MQAGAFGHNAEVLARSANLWVKRASVECCPQADSITLSIQVLVISKSPVSMTLTGMQMRTHALQGKRARREGAIIVTIFDNVV